MDEYPLIKLEIESMKHAILHHFNSYQQDLSNCVKKEIESAIKNFDFASEVRKAVHQVISGTIDQYFKWGDGSKLISSAMNEALNKTFNMKIDARDLLENTIDPEN